MDTFTKLEEFYYEAKGNIWLRYFTTFCRVVLALGFIPSGYVKIMGERFASGLSVNHPLGHYLEALHLTGYYYTFIGVVQLLIALLLLIPRTALLGALMYFPIILNICILAYATRFEGTRITSLMVLANLYVLGWNFDRLKHILPFKQSKSGNSNQTLSNKFPFKFFTGVFVTVASVILINQYLYELRPGNSLTECTNGCKDSKYPIACEQFCDCIYKRGSPLDKCLEEFKQAKEREKNNSLSIKTDD